MDNHSKTAQWRGLWGTRRPQIQLMFLFAFSYINMDFSGLTTKDKLNLIYISPAYLKYMKESDLDSIIAEADSIYLRALIPALKDSGHLSSIEVKKKLVSRDVSILALLDDPEEELLKYVMNRLFGKPETKDAALN